METLVAVPTWDGRISPVLDSAVDLLLVSVRDGLEIERRHAVLDSPLIAARAAQLAGLGIHTVICGAVSRPLRHMIEAGGVEFVANVCGDVDDVLDAFLTGTLDIEAFALPGSSVHEYSHGNGRHRARHRGRQGE